MTAACAVRYGADDVLTAARRRVAYVFAKHTRVVVSVSGGKDSTVLFHLAVEEAVRRGRSVSAFFLDQEAEYQSTIDVVAELMAHPNVEPMWFQVPIAMTNATSHRAPFLEAWSPGQEWMRDRHPLAVAATPGDDHPRRFYKFFPWLEAQQPDDTAFLVGLRSKESLNRFRAVSSKQKDGVSWSTRGAGSAVRYYPIYDWTFGDVWKFIAEGGYCYNRVYDWMYARSGANASSMRVSNLIHEKSFHALASLQEFEPATYDRLVRRLAGVHCAALYSGEDYVMAAGRLPAAHATWRAYRDHLLATTPGDAREKFLSRFARQPEDEATCRAQVRQVLINDWENNVPVLRAKADTLRARWWGRL